MRWHPFTEDFPVLDPNPASFDLAESIAVGRCPGALIYVQPVKNNISITIAKIGDDFVSHWTVTKESWPNDIPHFIRFCDLSLDEIQWSLRQPSHYGLRCGVIYFIATADKRFVKIGFTTRSVDYRLNEIQTGAAERLELIFRMAGDPRLEAMLHEKFSPDRVRHDGEWFEFSDAIKEFIESKEAKCPVRI